MRLDRIAVTHTGLGAPWHADAQTSLIDRTSAFITSPSCISAAPAVLQNGYQGFCCIAGLSGHDLATHDSDQSHCCSFGASAHLSRGRPLSNICQIWMRAMSTQGCSPEHLDFSISPSSPAFNINLDAYYLE